MAENTRILASALRKQPDLLSVKDLQSALNIGRSKAYTLLQSGAVKSIRVGSVYRIPKAFLVKYLNESI